MLLLIFCEICTFTVQVKKQYFYSQASYHQGTFKLASPDSLVASVTLLCVSAPVAVIIILYRQLPIGTEYFYLFILEPQ